MRFQLALTSQRYLANLKTSIGSFLSCQREYISVTCLSCPQLNVYFTVYCLCPSIWSHLSLHFEPFITIESLIPTYVAMYLFEESRVSLLVCTEGWTVCIQPSNRTLALQCQTLNGWERRSHLGTCISRTGSTGGFGCSRWWSSFPADIKWIAEGMRQ